MVTNSTEYQKAYMQKYNNSGETVHCPCCDKHIKKCRKHRHDKGKKHLRNLNDDKIINVLQSDYNQMKHELNALRLQ